MGAPSFMPHKYSVSLWERPKKSPSVTVVNTLEIMHECACHHCFNSSLKSARCVQGAALGSLSTWGLLKTRVIPVTVHLQLQAWRNMHF